MAIQTSVNGVSTHSTQTLIEAGEGKFIYDSQLTGSQPVVLDASKLDFPFEIHDDSTTEVLGGGWLAFPRVAGTPTATNAPTNELHAGEERDTAATGQWGSGAAIVTNTSGGETEEVYVRLNKVTFPIDMASSSQSIKVIGENSYIAFSA